MSLESGTRFGSCEVIELLGAGGMGEVYRGKDLHLEREVAIKVLPDRFAFDPQRLARFETEARILASLNHPNIAVLYGIDDSTGTQALLLELVAGETLADYVAARRRADRGLEIEEALAIAEQIAGALQAAHDHGIIHRDLKPSNVAIRPDGVVKLLDFGVAKTFDTAFGDSDASAMTISIADTILSSPAGTLSYMSPEQVRGSSADSRADIWAFGCVLFELLTGRRAFDGGSSAEVVADILKGAPDLEALPPETEPTVRRLLRRCLAKDPRERLRSIGDAALDIRDARAALRPGAVQNDTVFVNARPRGRFLPWTLGIGLGAAIATLSMLWSAPETPPGQPQVTRMSIVHAELGRIAVDEADQVMAITPDRSRLIIVGDSGTRLFVRSLDALEAVPIVSTAYGIRGPFASPDESWVGYIESNTIIKKVPITGGTPVAVLTIDGPSRGAVWTDEDRIVFATNNTATGLQSVSVFGGSVTVLTRPDAARDEGDHIFPEVLPGARALLMTVVPLSGRLDDARLAILDLRTGDWKTVVSGAYHGNYLNSGHLAYVSNGELHAIAFDLDRLAVRGVSRKVPLSLKTEARLAFAHMDIATNGTLAYVEVANPWADRALVWVDREGRENAVSGLPPGPYAYPRLSPDGTRFAFYMRDESSDIWIRDLRRNISSRITSGNHIDSWPLWISNTELAYTSLRQSGLGQVFLQSADGQGAARQLTSGRTALILTGATPDGSILIVSQLPAAGDARGWDLRTLKVDRSARDHVPVTEAEQIEGLDEFSNDRNGTLSPDGKWLAYDSDDLGAQVEVFVRPFPESGNGFWQVSTEGGEQPHWSPDGRELFYLTPDGTMMSVPVHTADAATWTAETPKPLFRGEYVTRSGGHIGRSYDVSADGKRFLMVKEQTSSLPQIIVVQNWTEELRRLLP